MLKVYGPAFAVLGFVLVAISFYFKHCYLGESDSLYYTSLGVSLAQSGRLLDISLLPASPAGTPQNGIAFIYALMSYLGCPRMQVPLGVSLFNALLMLLSVPAIIRICRELGMLTAREYLLPLTLILSSGVYVSCQLAPMNEAVFTTGSLWLLVLFLSSIDGMAGKGLLRAVLAVAALSAVVFQFRIQAVFLPAAGMIAGAMLFLHNRKRPDLLVVSGVSVIAGGLSLGAVALLLPGSIPAHAISTALTQMSGLFEGMITKTRTLWSVYVLLFIALAALAPEAFRKRNFRLLLVLLVSVIPLVWLLFLPSEAPVVRYSVYAYPLMFILFTMVKSMRPFGWLLCIWMLICNVAALARPIHFMPLTDMFSYAQKTIPGIGCDGALYMCEPWTDYSRAGWFFFGHPFVLGLCSDSMLSSCGDTVYLAGPEKFRDSAAAHIDSVWNRYGREVTAVDMLPGYSDAWGCGLLRLSVTAAQMPPRELQK